MKRVLIILAAAGLAAAAAWAGAPVYNYAGMWGKLGTGPGEFVGPFRLATASDGSVYVTDGWTDRVQYFTSSGSYLGQWSVPYAIGVDVSPRDIVYVTSAVQAGTVHYYTLTGSLLGSWDGLVVPYDVAVAPNGDVYVVELWGHCVSYFTSTGSFLGKWGKEGNGPGEFYNPPAIAVASNGTVYVIDGFDRVQYFTPSGSFLGMWGKSGEKPGELDEPRGIDVADAGHVFVANTYNQCVDYFTSTGSWLGIFGGYGNGEGQFVLPMDVTLSPSAKRVYVADNLNDRVQYFDETGVALVPTSLGRIRALFR